MPRSGQSGLVSRALLVELLRHQVLEDFVSFLAWFARGAWGATTAPQGGPQIVGTRIVLAVAEYESWLREASEKAACPQGTTDFRCFLEDSGLVRVDGDSVGMELWMRQISVIVDLLFPSSELALRADARYFALRSLRRHHRLTQTPLTARLFHLLADSLRSFCPPGNQPAVFVELREALSLQTKQLKDVSEESASILEAFLELCVFERIIKPCQKDARRVTVPEEPQDGDFLLSRVFGLPTAVRGLDNLFGGGGPQLGEQYEDYGDARLHPSGRIALISGQYGAGKTTLAMSLASAVARKGGLVYVTLLEQSVQECRYNLETLNLLGEINRPELCTTQEEWDHVLGPSVDSGKRRPGVICLLSHQNASLDARLDRIINMEKATRGKWPLRLIILDPVNAMADRSGQVNEDNLPIRALLAQEFGKLRERSMNLVLVTEDDTTSTVVQNLHSTADTVIRLSNDNEQGYKQRYVEILKNRLQREQRGLHPFSIKPGEGIAIFPSPASIMATERDRGNRAHQEAIEYGWPPFDKVLGSGAINGGDVIALTGESGTSKTDIGLIFALGANQPPEEMKRATGHAVEPRTLIIPLRESAQGIERLITASRYAALNLPKTRHHIIIREGLASGFIQPGRIMQAVSDAFEAAGPLSRIDRVFVDDVALWDRNCPFVRKDVTFIQTFIQFLRNKGVVMLFCLPPGPRPEDIAQTSILGAADVHVQFRTLEYRGSRQAGFNVIKSRSLSSLRGLYSVRCTNQSIHLGREFTQFRLSATGEISLINIVLILHAENHLQGEYNNHLLASLQQLFGETISIQERDRTLGVSLGDLRDFSTVDRLQIQQIDDFQIDSLLGAGGGHIHCYPLQETRDFDLASWKEGERERLVINGEVCAFPYLRNRARLFYHLPRSAATATGSWKELVALARKHETSPDVKEEEIFFAFDNRVLETYAVLFLEIFLGNGGTLPEQAVELEAWPSTAKFREALEILVALCARFVRLQAESRFPSKGGATLRPKVFRAWYTSCHSDWLGQALSGTKYRSVALPGRIEISGDWYLVVPSESASSELALRIIKRMVSQEQQLERFERGVGLPISQGFFQTEPDEKTEQNLGFFQSFRETSGKNTKVYRRAAIPGYHQFHSVLAKHLHDAILLGPDLSVRTLEELTRLISSDIRFAVTEDRTGEEALNIL